MPTPTEAGSPGPAGCESSERPPGGWRRRMQLLAALTRSDLRIRYGRGGWQVVNWLANPFALVGIYVLLRVILGRAGHDVALSIACAVVPFQIVLLGFESATNCVGLREPVLLNRRFDRMLLPPSSVLTEGFAFGASFLMFPIAMAYYGVAPTAALLWLPFVIGATFVLALGLAWPAALLGVWLPNIGVFSSQGLRILFFAAPGIVALSEVPEHVRRYIVFNPLTGLFESYRHVFLFGDGPPFWQLAYPTAVGIALTLLFVPIYRREQPHFAKLVRS